MWLVAGCAASCAAPTRSDSDAPHPATLCVTSGALVAHAGGSLANDRATLRAVAPAGGERGAELAFTFHGATAVQEPLASGEMRQQLGLKLRAIDACNLVYVMWRVAEDGPLVVSVKRNPGLRASSECGARGYVRVVPRVARDLTALSAGESHTLGAKLTGETLRVRVDGALAWEGELPPAANDLSGPAGLRSDNVRWSGRLALDPPSADARCP